METKKIILAFFMLVILALPTFASIQEYSVPSEMPLNLEITATGISVNDINVPNVNQLCSFYFLSSDSGNLIDRMTDQYTDQTGRFSMPKFKITEPDFIRGKNYTLKTTCGSNEEDATFIVTQKQEAFDIFGYKFYPQAFVMDVLYWNDPINSTIFFLALLMILALFGIWMKYFWGSK